MVIKIFFLIFYLLPSISYSCFPTNSASAPTLTGTTTTTTTLAATTTTTTVAVLACATCTEIDRVTDTGIGVDQTLTQTITTGADGCVTVTITCTADVATAQTVLTFYEAGVDVGTLEGVGIATTPLTCNAAGELTYTTALGTGVVDQVECTAI